MRLPMHQPGSRIRTETRRLSLEAGLGSFVGALVAGAAALLLVSTTRSLALACGGMLATAILVAWWSHGRARRSLELVDAIRDAVDGLSDGQRIARLDDSQVGSAFAPVAQSFNRIFDVLNASAQRVLAVVQSVRSLPERIVAMMRQIESAADAQEAAVEETASLLANINTSMHEINEQIDRLQRSAEESASSILQMGSSVDEVARNVATLHESVETSTSSVHEMGASIRQVAQSAEQVERIAEETAASMVEMDRAIQEVSGHAREAAGLTERVSQGAERGSQAVSDTISDIEQIRELTNATRETLGTLVARIAEIGGILTGIGEINDETNLLSLNAAIIAAQAGEQGKAFLVVANHVKTLAKRTAASTQDIERLVQDIQDESVAAVKAMGAGIDAIEKGVTRSRSAGDALDEILSTSREAFKRVEGIARAVDEQSRSTKLVAQAAQDTSTQVQQISSAMSEQSNVGEKMLKSAEAALEVCRHVHRSTEEQKETGRYITSSISSITEMIRLIKNNAHSHASASGSVSEAVMRLLENAQDSGKQVPEVNALLSELGESAQVIIEELSRFADVGFER